GVPPAASRAMPPPPAVADPEWQRYVGRYRNAWADAQVLVMGGKLTIIFPNLPDPLWAPATLVPVGEHTFRIETKDGYGSHGEHAAFEFDGNGQGAPGTLRHNHPSRVT